MRSRKSFPACREEHTAVPICAAHAVCWFWVGFTRICVPGGAQGPAAAAAGEEAVRLALCLAPARAGFMAWGKHEVRLLEARYASRRYPRHKTLCACFLPSQTTGLPPSPLNTATIQGLLFAQASICHFVVTGDRSSHRGKDRGWLGPRLTSPACGMARTRHCCGAEQFPAS